MRCSKPCSPLLFLTRLVLGSALFLAGWQLTFGTAMLTVQEQQLLDGMPAALADAPRVVLVTAAFQAESPTRTIDDIAADIVERSRQEAAIEAAMMERRRQEAAMMEGIRQPTDSSTDQADSNVEAKAVYKLALALHTGGLGGPGASAVVAWTVALVQLIGGAMLVLGLLTRVWAAVAIVVLGGLCCFQPAGMFDMNPLHWASNPAHFTLLYAQLGGVVLGLGLLGYGGGMLSLDQFLFGRPAHADPDDAE